MTRRLRGSCSRRFVAVLGTDNTIFNGSLQVFRSDILNLLSMADMWKTRAPPVPLSFEGIKNGSFILRGKPANVTMSNGTAAPVNSQNGHGASTSAAGAGLKDQKTLTLQDNLELFVSRCGLGNQ